MKTELIVIGKTSNKHISALIDDYIERINHYMPFEMTCLQDTKRGKAFSEEIQKEREADAILSKINSSHNVILLDEHGKNTSSLQFADWLNKQKQTGKKMLFIIGGPYGFSNRVYKRANDMVSLSKLTFSHDMARMIFCEQIYRACTILKGESYHHE